MEGRVRAATPGSKRLAVIGAGWAGLATAVGAVQRGYRVSVFEMADHPGGRARSMSHAIGWRDNGQHLLIGAYSSCLSLMQTVGVDTQAVLLRQALRLVDPQGQGLVFPHGPAAWAFSSAVLGHPQWSWAEKFALLGWAGRQALRGFRCHEHETVEQLCTGWSSRLRRELIDPLCIAALNTAPQFASGRVFLKVLADSFFAGAGALDLLIPRRPLNELLPAPATRWLQAQGVSFHWRHRVREVSVALPDMGNWCVDGANFDQVVLACPAWEAARLAMPHAPEWSKVAQAQEFDPIATVVVDAPGARLAAPMVCLRGGPAQFAFDHGQLGGPPGRLVLVISDAALSLGAGVEALAQAALGQARDQLCTSLAKSSMHVVSVLAEKRATFRAQAGRQVPPARLMPSLWAVGDYVFAPYPSTLEAAVRSAQVVTAQLPPV